MSVGYLLYRRGNLVLGELGGVGELCSWSSAFEQLEVGSILFYCNLLVYRELLIHIVE